LSDSTPRPRRWLRALLGLFLVGLLAVGGGAFWLWQQYLAFVDAPVAGLSAETDVILQHAAQAVAACCSASKASGLKPAARSSGACWPAR
jgi:hypothetical protein